MESMLEGETYQLGATKGMTDGVLLLTHNPLSLDVEGVLVEL